MSTVVRVSYKGEELTGWRRWAAAAFLALVFLSIGAAMFFVVVFPWIVGVVTIVGRVFA